MPDNFQPNEFYPWFDRAEFEYLGLEVEDAYFSAAEECALNYAESMSDMIAQYEGKQATWITKDDGTKYDLNKKMLADYQKEWEELKPLYEYAKKVESQFIPFLEDAWAKVIQLLHSGELVVEGIDFEEWSMLSDDGEYFNAAKFVPLNGADFRVGYDWDSNEISINGRKYVALRLNVSNILKFQKLLFQAQGKTITVKKFGAGYIGQENKSVTSIKRGRKTIVDWSAIRGKFSEMVARNAIPQTKEDCIYEMIAFAEKTLNRTPSRSAVQRQLHNEFKEVYG